MRVLTIGAGYFAALHVDAWQRHPDATLVGVCDLDVDRAESVAKGAAFGTDAAAMIDEVRPDIIDIATPPPTHLAMIDIALTSDCAMIICQKPFCDGLPDAQKAVTRAAGRCLVVHENFRFQTWYRAVAKEMSSGRLGRVLSASFRLRPGDGLGEDAYLDRQPYFREMPRFLVHETAVHFVDVFRYLFGEVDGIYADLRRINPVIAGEDTGMIIMDHADGIQTHFDGNRTLDHAADNLRITMGELRVEGTEAEVTVDGAGNVRRRMRGQTDWQIIASPPATDLFGGDCVYNFQDHVLAHLIHGAPLETLAKDYIRNMELVEAVYQSALEGRKISM